MKKLTLTILTCLIFLSPNVVMSETMDDLEKRDGVYYKKSREVPFTGRVTGQSQGLIKNGKKEGSWQEYNGGGRGHYKNGKRHGFWEIFNDPHAICKDEPRPCFGTLFSSGRYENGKADGVWTRYYELEEKLYSVGNYKNGKLEGAETVFYFNGPVKWISNYKNGKYDGPYFFYDTDGQLKEKGTYRNGERHGLWITYNRGGIVDTKDEKTYKNGIKISD